jgi:hypothetical protein
MMAMSVSGSAGRAASKGCATVRAMPKAFDTWRVFPHRPIEKLEPNLWRVEGDLPNGNGTRVMTIARLRDGSLVIHNAIALEEELMKEIEAFGKPAVLVVPNGFHRLDAPVFKKRYPSLRVVCPAGSRKRVEQVIPVDATYSDALKDDDVRLFHLQGTRDAEGVLEVRSNGKTTIVLNDAVNNLPKLGGLFGFLLAPTGKPSVPRLARWMMVKDKAAFRAHLDQLASTANLGRLIVSHGKMMADQPANILRAVAAAL